MPRISEDKQAQRRSHILDAAELCFARAGFHRTTMQDICKQAAVSPGALYLYFDSKESLIDGIVERDREEVLEHLSQVAEAPDFLKALEQVLHACVFDQPHHKAALFVEIAAEACRNPRVGAALTHCDSVLRQTLENLLLRARAEGRLPAGHDATVVTMIMAVIGDALIFRRATHKAFDSAQITPVLMQMMAGLLFSETPQSPQPVDPAAPPARIRMI